MSCSEWVGSSFGYSITRKLCGGCGPLPFPSPPTAATAAIVHRSHSFRFYRITTAANPHHDRSKPTPRSQQTHTTIAATPHHNRSKPTPPSHYNRTEGGVLSQKLRCESAFFRCLIGAVGAVVVVAPSPPCEAPATGSAPSNTPEFADYGKPVAEVTCGAEGGAPSARAGDDETPPDASRARAIARNALRRSRMQQKP